MYADSVRGSSVHPMFWDLDAIELLTLTCIFERARHRVATHGLLGLMDHTTSIDMQNELGVLYAQAFRSCAVRCASISLANEFYMSLPDVVEWRDEKRHGSSGAGSA